MFSLRAHYIFSSTCCVVDLFSWSSSSSALPASRRSCLFAPKRSGGRGPSQLSAGVSLSPGSSSLSLFSNSSLSSSFTVLPKAASTCSLLRTEAATTWGTFFRGHVPSFSSRHRLETFAEVRGGLRKPLRSLFECLRLIPTSGGRYLLVPRSLVFLLSALNCRLKRAFSLDFVQRCDLVDWVGGNLAVITANQLSCLRSPTKVSSLLKGFSTASEACLYVGPARKICRSLLACFHFTPPPPR